MPYSERHAGRDSASSSSSITLMSDTKPPRKASSISAHDAPSHSQSSRHAHLPPLVSVTTLDEGSGIKTIGPPIPLAGAGEVSDDDDVLYKARGDVEQALGSGSGDADKGVVKENDIFNRFTPRRKIAIVAIVSYCSFISRKFSGSSFGGY